MSATEAEDLDVLAGTQPESSSPKESTTQWRLDTLQVLNWGGFHGHHTLKFHPDATLLSGGSGTGKSTLLDAYTALMMPSSVAFNGASNNSGTGRARNEEGGQRTLLTYLRGKLGVHDETGGASSENLLRGNGQPTWGAIAATFVDRNHNHFSAARVFFVPASASDIHGITGRMVTIPAAIDLQDLIAPMGKHTAGKPLAHVITSTWNGVKSTTKYSEFSNTLFSKLAIGANGDGAKALDLLARIQAGRPVNSVNALYRDLVLDTPATFRNADLALEHFDVIAGDLAKMIEAERQHTALRDIREVHANLEKAHERLAALDHYGLNSTGVTKLTVWSWRKEGEILDDATDLARQRYSIADAETHQAHLEVDRLWGDLETTREVYREAGGDELKGLDRQIEQLNIDLSNVTRSRVDLLEHLTAIGRELISHGEFDNIQEDARKFARERETWTTDYNQRRDSLVAQIKPLSDEQKRLENDLKHLMKSGTRIKSYLGTQRDRVADRIGMRPIDLPFLAELIDIPASEVRWRNAIETVLGPDASRIVIPKERRREIARLINEMNADGQIRLIDGTANVQLTYPLDGASTADQVGRILGKLQFADHPYAGWVQQHLAGQGLNALCVETTDELDGGGLRVTEAGQVRGGIRSSIGRRNGDNIIGFSAADEIERVEADLDRTNIELGHVLRDISDLEEQAKTHTKRNNAYIAVLRYRWDEVDVNGVQARIAAAEERQNQILNSDNKLQALKAQIKDLQTAHQKALGTHATADAKAKQLEKAWTILTDAKDNVTDRLLPHDDNDAYDLTEDQAADLAVEYAAARAGVSDEDAIDEATRFSERLFTMQQSLGNQAKTVQKEVDDNTASLTKTFGQYLSVWNDPNLTDSLASYPDFLRILEQLEAKGLYETREEWQQAIANWSAQDLLPLSQSLSSEVDAIKARVEPINDILKTLPFGAKGGRLCLKVADVNSESVRLFRKNLRRITTLATKPLNFDHTRKVFEEIAAFMDVLRDPKDPKHNPEKSDRVKLLDVRRHVEVYAVEYPVDSDTWQAREHRHLGSASGGESQELIAFIIGSALRFRLGDELRDWPQFAPVFLDEGFVKADSEFAGRAVTAWRRLGFQIIVGTPEDKFTGLERHMESFIVVYKDQETGYSYVDQVTDHRTIPTQGSQ